MGGLVHKTMKSGIRSLIQTIKSKYIHGCWNHAIWRVSNGVTFVYMLCMSHIGEKQSSVDFKPRLCQLTKLPNYQNLRVFDYTGFEKQQNILHAISCVRRFNSLANISFIYFIKILMVYTIICDPHQLSWNPRILNKPLL